MELMINLSDALYNRLTEIMITYNFINLDDAMEQCIGNTYIEMIMQGKKPKKQSSILFPVQLLELVDEYSQSLYRNRNNYIRETIEQALVHKEAVADLISICPNGYYDNARKITSGVVLDTGYHEKFKKLCQEVGKPMSQVLTELLYYRLKVMGAIEE